MAHKVLFPSVRYRALEENIPQKYEELAGTGASLFAAASSQREAAATQGYSGQVDMEELAQSREPRASFDKHDACQWAA
jgi:hypothetical protein